MAFDQGGLWLVIFRVPADDYAHQHVMQIGGTDNERVAREHFANRHANPDARVEEFRKIASPGETADATARVMRDGGPSYRMLQAGEQHLTSQHVATLRGRPAPAVPGDETPDARAARAAAEIRTALAGKV